MNTDHIVHNATMGKFACKFCGAVELPPFMPAPISVIIDAMDVFTNNHKDCKKPQQLETVMSEYIKGFDAGYEYVLHEMERYIRVREFEPRVANPLKDLLAHLKMEKTPNESN